MISNNWVNPIGIIENVQSKKIFLSEQENIPTSSGWAQIIMVSILFSSLTNVPKNWKNDRLSSLETILSGGNWICVIQF